jgi:competence protein ComGC
MKKNGYTVFDILILILVLSVSAMISLPKMSYAFKSDKDELYDGTIALYLKEATAYGNANKAEIKKSESKVVTINDLIDAGYIGAYVSHDLIDIRDNKTVMNDLKIKLIYDADSDSVYAEMV